MEPRISFITLGVVDLERSISFYRDGLDLPQRKSPPNVAFFGTSCTWLSLYERLALAEDAFVFPQGYGFRGFTLGQVVKSRAEVDTQMEKAASIGAKIMTPAKETSCGGYAGYFADPDGYLWEIIWEPGLMELAA